MNSTQSRYWLLVILLAAPLACRPPEAGVARPDNLLPPDQMAAALTEIHVAEARVSRMGLRSTDSSEFVFKALRQRIFAKQKIDTASFSASYNYYAAHPDKLEKLYQIVVDTLQARTKSTNNAPPTSSLPNTRPRPL